MQIDTWNRAEMNISGPVPPKFVPGPLPQSAQSPPDALYASRVAYLALSFFAFLEINCERHYCDLCAQVQRLVGMSPHHAHHQASDRVLYRAEPGRLQRPDSELPRMLRGRGNHHGGCPGEFGESNCF